MGPDLSIVARHKKPVLQFSGGMDSLACLWLLERYWPRLTVAWVNTGDAFPETLELMERVKPLVAEFIEVRTDQAAQIARYGYPVDMLPVRNHPGMQMLFSLPPRPKLQSFWACCSENVVQPMFAKMKEIGATLVIRGMRKSEAQHTPLENGARFEGIEYLFPLLEWSADDVRRYLKDKPLGLPEHYAQTEKSLDCMHCTAWLFEGMGKRRYMAEKHPEAYREVTRRLDVISGAAFSEMQHIKHARHAGRH